MLYTIAIVLAVLWLLGLVTSYTMGGFIHILLVLAVIMILVQVIQGRRIEAAAVPADEVAGPQGAAWGSNVRLVVRAAAQEQDTANDNRRKSRPQGHIHVLLFTQRQVNAAYVSLMGRFGVGKSAIGERQGACHDQYQCRQFVRIHLNFSGRSGWRLFVLSQVKRAATKKSAQADQDQIDRYDVVQQPRYG